MHTVGEDMFSQRTLNRSSTMAGTMAAVTAVLCSRLQPRTSPIDAANNTSTQFAGRWAVVSVPVRWSAVCTTEACFGRCLHCS